MSAESLYFDCFSGISGDMTVAALVDLGCDGSGLEAEIAKLGLEEGVELGFRKVNRTGITATKFDVAVAGGKDPAHGHHHRSHAEIAALIEGSSLNDGVKRRARAIFAKIAAAEAKIHGVPVGEVHFHEVGAVDSIVDIVAVALLLESLGPMSIISSPVTVGSGQVRTMHGLYPVPAPATLEILRGAPVRAGDAEGEMTTPTGAGILAACVDRWSTLPELKVVSIGYGAGTKESQMRPNVLRLISGNLLGSERRHEGDHTQAHYHDHTSDHPHHHHHADGHVHEHDHAHDHAPHAHDSEKGKKGTGQRGLGHSHEG